MFRIGAFARLAGVSAKVLRAWDALGLFRPLWVDPVTAYRWYSPAQLPELRRIVALRDVGVPLAEIADLVAGGADLRLVLARRRAALERERREVARRLRALRITVADGAGPDVVVRPVAAELVACLPVDVTGGDVGAAFYDLEAHVRDAGRRASRPPLAIADERDGHRIGEVVVPITGALPETGSVTVRRLAAAQVASVIHRGAYGGLAARRAALDRWVAAAGFVPAGPLRILYLQFGAEADLRVPRAWLVDDDADFVTELQQPVTRPSRSSR